MVCGNQLFELDPYPEWSLSKMKWISSKILSYDAIKKCFSCKIATLPDYKLSRG